MEPSGGFTCFTTFVDAVIHIEGIVPHSCTYPLLHVHLSNPLLASTKFGGW